MNMQDKEFDDLFRSKLSGMEAEPSANVWKGIAAELGQKQKRSIAPMLRIAAAVLVIIAAGTWFVVDSGEEHVNRLSHTKAVVKPTGVPKAEDQLQTAPSTQGTSTVSETIVPQVQPVQQVAAVKRNAKQANGTKVVEAKTKPDVVALQVQPAQALAAATPEKQPVTHELPNITLTAQNITVEPSAFHSASDVPTTTITVASAQPEKKKKHGIRSLGDLVNVVVAKIDKRETKIIEFTETDEDQSTVTGLNLGILSVKKEK
jgi:hypothetical protein